MSPLPSSSVSSMMLAGLVASIVVATGSPTATLMTEAATSGTVPVTASETSTFASSAASSTLASSPSSESQSSFSTPSRQQQKQQQHQKQKEMKTSSVIQPPSAVATGADSEDKNQKVHFDNVGEKRQHYDDVRSKTTQTKKSNMNKKSSMLRMPYIQQDELPIENVRQKWQSLSEDVEFVPSDQIDPKIVGRFLEQQQDNNYYGGEDEEGQDDDRAANDAKYKKIYGVEPFSYGDVEYDGYQQAWRLLGFIIDCNPLVDDDYFQNSGSGDQGTEDGCARYVLWAAVSSYILSLFSSFTFSSLALCHKYLFFVGS